MDQPGNAQASQVFCYSSSGRAGTSGPAQACPICRARRGVHYATREVHSGAKSLKFDPNFSLEWVNFFKFLTRQAGKFRKIGRISICNSLIINRIKLSFGDPYFFLSVECILVYFTTTRASSGFRREQQLPAIQGIHSLQDGPQVSGFRADGMASGSGGRFVSAVFQGA